MDKLIRWTTVAAVLMVAVIAAVVSYEHAYDLVRAHGETGFAAHGLPLTIDGMIWAASMVMLDASRRDGDAPRLAWLGLAVGIAASLCANVVHGLGHGWTGAIVSAWPAAALVVSFELLMLLLRASKRDDEPAGNGVDRPEPIVEHIVVPVPPTVEQVVHAWVETGKSRRQIAADFDKYRDRRNIAKLLDETRVESDAAGPGVDRESEASSPLGRAPSSTDNSTDIDPKLAPTGA